MNYGWGMYPGAIIAEGPGCSRDHEGNEGGLGCTFKGTRSQNAHWGLSVFGDMIYNCAEGSVYSTILLNPGCNKICQLASGRFLLV